ncbi:MAG TPA: NADH-quinone oxidoreductase subunit C [Thermoanaerobaculia bacterium]|nr:NADH-quinone oxidoreductase subunit C [Thermoanaerobaculia bacterium]
MSDERDTPGSPPAGAGDASPAPAAPAAPAPPAAAVPAAPSPTPTPTTPTTPAAPRPAAPAAAKPAPTGPAWERDSVLPEWHDAAGDPLAAALKEEFGEAIESARTLAGDLTLAVRRDAVAQVAAALKAKHRFTYLVDVCGADYPKRTPRFDVVYHLHSFEANRRIRLKVTTDEATPVPSVTGVWRVANWPEREVYDMYGVRFTGHPDMTRILLWEGFNGYPLRKDFPIEGIDTGAAIYPEYYTQTAGPVAGTGTGWKPAGTVKPTPPKPPAPAVAPKPAPEKEPAT